MRNSNNYIIIFAVVVTVISAILLAGAATILKPFQDANLLREKQQNILKVVGRTSEEDLKNFDKLIQPVVLNDRGEEVPGKEAMSIDMALEKRIKLKNPKHDLNFPMYIYTSDEGKKTYILQLAGTGLWGPIWGYLALDEDGNTVKQALFDHKGETPGLGAEINTAGFQDQFANKKVYNENGEFVSVKVEKGKHEASDLHKVDAISGGTITSNGVSKMIEEDVKFYMAYIKKQKGA